MVSVLYLLLGGAALGIGGFLGYREWFPISYHLTYIGIGVWMLLLGILNVYVLSSVLPWSNENSFGTEMQFTILTALLGGIGLVLVFYFLDFRFFILINLSALLLYILPYILYGTVKKYMKIPVKIFRMWHYPYEKHVEDPTDREMESPLVIGFEFKKNYMDKSVTTFRAKAPKEMIFGKLFYYFINDYNHRNPDEKIEFLDDNKKPQAWIFYFKPKLFRKVRYIDPEETNSFNFVKENSVIVCKRVIEV